MFGYVYLTTNLINNRKYIGKRQKSYFDTSYLGSGMILKEAVKKYGKENFNCIILKECNSLEELNESEKEFISLYNATNNPEFYNIAHGGTGGNTGTQYKGQPANHIQTLSERKKRSDSLKLAYKEGRHPIIYAGYTKNKHRSEADAERCRTQVCGFKWIHNDTEEKRVSPNVINEFLNNGWLLGRLKRK